MTIGAVGAIASGGSVYAALSPYLNGVQRTSDAEAAGQAQERVATIDAQATAPAVVSRETTPIAPSFLNPAIGDIAARASVTAVTASPTDPVLYGESGLVIQSWSAVALLVNPLNIFIAYGKPVAPAVSPIEPLTGYPGTERIDCIV